MNEYLSLSYLIANTISVQWEALFVFIPVLIIVELPLFMMVYTGLFRWYWKENIGGKQLSGELDEAPRYPTISFIITCYGEGDDITITIDTLAEQIYPAQIEILAVVDGAKQNQHTYDAAMRAVRKYRHTPGRNVRIVPKWQRGGRVSTLNAGLSMARNEIIINVDGDTSFDNDMALNMVRQFADPQVVASGGALRVRNEGTNLLTRMQSLEYMMSMQGNKTGMAEYGLLNNISGAFGAFRKQILKRAGGWDTHTAEDLDLTMRLKQYQTRNPKQKLVFTPHAVGHTEVPDTVKNLVMQRLRWDGDLLFLYLRKHIKGLTPGLLGWKTFLYTYVYGVIQNTLLPVMMALFMFYMFSEYTTKFTLSVMLLLYCVYLFFVVLNYLVYLTFVSERFKQDARMAVWLPLYPVYTFLIRFVTAFSIVNEIIRRSHEESSMAPWWVLKRGRRF